MDSNTETDRLDALRATGLLDTEPEAAFDRLTRLASRVLQAPVALISLADESRQFFKSAVGLPEPWASLRQAPLSHSFCQLVLRERAPLLIADARLDVRLVDDKAIEDFGAIAFAGAPLLTRDGHAIGVLCVMDRNPRQWAPDVLETLGDLSALLITEIELRSATRALQVQAAEFRSTAMFDELTGLFNRRGFLLLAERHLELARRSRSSMTLIFADLDGMTQINEGFGRDEGDHALVDTAEILRETFRGTDIVARLGDDKFAALLVGPVTESGSVLPRLQENLEKHSERAHRPFKLEIRTGITHFDSAHHASMEAFLDEAVRLMAERKTTRKPVEPPRPVRERPLILVADDDPPFLRLMMVMLQSHGYDVVTAADGEEAWKKAQDVVPDLVLSDVMMPKMDGWTFIERLRALPQFSTLPVLFLTALASEENRLRGFLLGADGYMSKPISPTGLGWRIAKLLNRPG